MTSEATNFIIQILVLASSIYQKYFHDVQQVLSQKIQQFYFLFDSGNWHTLIDTMSDGNIIYKNIPYIFTFL
jgi:hypothetical protein